MEQHLRNLRRKRKFLFLVLMICCNSSNAQTDPLYYSPGEDLVKKTARYLFLQVETDKKEALAGESIMAFYHLYVAVDIQGKLSKSPSFTGFASYDIEGGDTDAYEVKKINGIPFRVYLVKKVQLYGLRPGLQRLEPVELEASIRYRKIPEDIIDFMPSSGGNADTVINYTLKSAPREILIKKLPENPTGDFSGAVGNFEISAYASTNNLPAGKADTLYWQLKGNGNWHEIILPQINWPEGAEVFEPSVSENLNTRSFPVEGLRTLAYPVVFGKKGDYRVAPLSFTFFNPETGQYQTIKSDSIPITVTEPIASEENKMPDEQSHFTSVFSRIAIIVFPVAAAVLLGLLIFKRKKG